MSGRCTNCGGFLRFDISTQNVICDSCDSIFDPEIFADADTAADEVASEDLADTTVNNENIEEVASENQEFFEEEAFDATVFLCPNCGAQIEAAETDAVDYCVYCGSFVTLESSVKRIRKPDYIIPFTKTIDDCKELFKEKMAKKIYAPKEFRKDAFLDGFKGMYIPYWNYEATYGPSIKLHGEDEERDGDYLITRYFEIDADAQGVACSHYYDASSSFDDTVSQNINDYDTEERIDYNPAYMYGFYADTADIDPDLYAEYAQETVENSIYSYYCTNKFFVDGNPNLTKPESFSEDFNTENYTCLLMLPVWFLTWRKKNRVAYSVVNANSGTIHTEVPVDKGRYLLFSLLTAIPLFFLFNLLFTVSASKIVSLSVILAGIAIVAYSILLDKIVRRFLHADDEGFLSKHRKERWKVQNFRENLLTSFWDCLTDLFDGASFGDIAITILIFLCLAISFWFGVYIIALLIPVYLIYRIIKCSIILKDWTVCIDCLGVLVSITLGLIIKTLAPAPDEFYYMCAIVCMVGVGFTAVRTMGRYNDLITRPIPHFFTSEEETGNE